MIAIEGLTHLIIFEDPNSPEFFQDSLPPYIPSSLTVLPWSLHTDIPDLRTPSYNGFRVWQRTFYSYCFHELKRLGVDWGIPIDSDEFYVPLVPLSSENDRRCLDVQRITFDGVDSGGKFVTERFRNRALNGARDNRLGKQIINLKKVTEEEWRTRFDRSDHLSFNVHSPLLDCSPWSGHLNHYLRTEEEFYHREDPRRGTEKGWFEYRKGFETVEEEVGFMTEWITLAEKKWGKGWDSHINRVSMKRPHL